MPLNVTVEKDLPVDPPVKSVTVKLTPVEAQVLVYVAGMIGGGSTERDGLTISRNNSKEYNPYDLSLVQVRDTLRTIGNTINVKYGR